MNNRKVTMADVARRASVSKSAVSFAFNDSKRLSDQTLQRIMQAADELGFTQNPAARMLRTRRTDSLGLLLPQQLDSILDNPYYSVFLQGIGQTCHREGFTLLLAPPLRGSMLKAIPYAAVDGFIVAGLEHDRGEVTALRKRGIPFVLVDSEPLDDVASVDIDDSEGIEELVSYLLQQGHKRITFVAFEAGVDGGYTQWKGPVKLRVDGAVRAFQMFGFSEPEGELLDVVEVPCTRTGGNLAFRRLWERAERPTAIVAFSDIIAYGVLDAARDLGVRVPQDVSVSGFDDLAESSWTTPSLTTIRQPITTKGRLAAEYLVESIASSSLSQRHHQQRLNTTLILRDSTGPAR